MMAKQKMNINELYAATGKILVEKGYAGFHFKLVSDQLNVSRSTIYEYFSNKDELIASLMVHLMDTIMAEYEGLDRISEPLEKLRRIFDSFMKYAHLHQILLFAPFVNGESSPSVKKDLVTLRQQHHTLTSVLTEVIDACKEAGSIRPDIPSSLVASLLFQSIQIPKNKSVEDAEWSEMIFRVLLEGYGIRDRHGVAF
ncbi:TetR/AcrR family transcriptional regulator [Brevibacillus nitrificans]|uniref:TetR/AcrR family transcriptional regulator n=1 Tax=Brevibacillus nitrificans TaxID=651560 RepID=UPI002854C06E|nr:TetR/AcrR family transcriptional regulator [Brevibacillus nitrificans]MDR7315844.1 AcrR family transcriptional regulator [Brevibacillus nitrificans]